jgi:hypothetical protein
MVRAAKGTVLGPMGPEGRPSGMVQVGELGPVPSRSVPRRAREVALQGPQPSAVPQGMASTPTGDCADVLDDVDSLLLSIDGDGEGRRKADCGEKQSEEKIAEELADVVVEPNAYSYDSGAVPWLDRYDTTERLLEQLEETLRLMESRGVNLTSAWELATTARALLESADVVQALIYANRAFRVALDTHRTVAGTGGAAS